MTDLPDRIEPPADLPANRLSNHAFEQVIRRAAELQARDAEDVGGDGIDETEVLRIGRELGLSTQHLHRALVEVKGAEEPESGVLGTLFGPARIHAGRTIRGDAREIATALERHLVEREYLAVLRRFPDRVVFTRASGVVAALGRASSQVFNRSPLLGVPNLEVSSQPLEEGFGYVTLATSLGGQRTSTAAVSILGGGSGAAFTAAALAIAVAPPVGLLGLSVLGGAVFGGHVYYERAMRKVQIQLESLLDRLEHGELTRQPRGRALPWR